MAECLTLAVEVGECLSKVIDLCESIRVKSAIFQSMGKRVIKPLGD